MGLLGKLFAFGKREDPAQAVGPAPAAAAQLPAIDECSCCKLPLPLRLPKPGERAGNWQCSQCGYRYVAVIDENRHPDLLAHIRPAACENEKVDVEPGQEDVASFVNNMHVDRERRIAKRNPLETILLVTPLDDDHQPIADPFLCRTADFSSTGVRIIHSEPVDAKFLMLEHLSPSSDQIRVLVRVTRIKMRENGCEIGAKFVNDETPRLQDELAAGDGLPPSSIALPIQLPENSGDDILASLGNG